MDSFLLKTHIFLTFPSSFNPQSENVAVGVDRIANCSCKTFSLWPTC